MSTSSSMIMVAVDESAASFAALDVAAAEARRRDCSLRLVHVQDTPPNHQRRFRLRTQGAELLEAFTDRAHQREPGVPVGSELAIGDPADTLVDRSAGARLLVIGKRGRGGLSELLTSSVSARTAGYAHCPVLVVRVPPPGGEPERDGNPVLVGVDGPYHAEQAVRFALDEARLRRVGLVALHARAQLPAYVGGGHLDPLATGPLADDALPATLNVRREYPDSDPSAALIAASTHACLAVVGSRGRSGFGRAPLGPVTLALLHYAHCPVAVLQPQLATPHFATGR